MLSLHEPLVHRQLEVERRLACLFDDGNVLAESGLRGLEVALQPLHLLLCSDLVIWLDKLHLPSQVLELAVAVSPDFVDMVLLPLLPDVVQVVQQLVDHALAHVKRALVAEVVSDLECFRWDPVIELGDGELFLVFLRHDRFRRNFVLVRLGWKQLLKVGILVGVRKKLQKALVLDFVVLNLQLSGALRLAIEDDFIKLLLRLEQSSLELADALVLHVELRTHRVGGVLLEVLGDFSHVGHSFAVFYLLLQSGNFS